MSPTYRPATINSVEATATVSGSTGGGRDEKGNVYFFPNVSVSIGYWFDNEGVPSSDWDTHFTAQLWINGGTGRQEAGPLRGGPQTYTFFAHKFPAPAPTSRGSRKNSKSIDVTIKNLPVQEKKAAQ
jgi:hypothetical protein